MFLTVLHIPILITAPLCGTLVVLTNLLKKLDIYIYIYIYKCCLRLTLNGYKNDYKTLLDKSVEESMKIRRIKTLAIEIFKTVHELNPNFMETLFTSKTNFRVRPFDLLVKNRNTEKYGSKSLMALGPKIWNALPENINETSFSKFKEYIKSWSGPTCKCKICLSI